MGLIVFLELRLIVLFSLFFMLFDFSDCFACGCCKVCRSQWFVVICFDCVVWLRSLIAGCCLDVCGFVTMLISLW